MWLVEIVRVSKKWIGGLGLVTFDSVVNVIVVCKG